MIFSKAHSWLPTATHTFIEQLKYSNHLVGLTAIIGIMSIANPVIANANEVGSLSENDATQQSQLSSKTPENNTILNLGINAIYSDKGFTNYPSETMVVPSLAYEKKNFYVRGNQFGFKSHKGELGQVSAYAQYAGVAYDADKATGAFNKLDDRDSAMMFGIAYQKMTKVGSFSGQINKDLFGKSNGVTAKLGYSAFAKIGKLIMFPSVGVQWQDENYNDYYYGVTTKESQKTGINSYEPKDSVHPYISVMGNYKINEELNVFLNQNVSYYADEQRNSPKVAEKMAFSSVVGLSYQF